MTFDNLKYIVTHPGKAHMDDFMSCCIALGAIKWNIPIFRREPTDSDLKSSNVLVLDIGGKFNPLYMNFDHHQLPRGTKESTLSLLQSFLSLEPEYLPLWWDSAVEIDSLGPIQYAKNHNIPTNTVMELCSPIDGFVLSMFNLPEVNASHMVYFLMKQIGESFWQRYELMRKSMEDLRTNGVMQSVNGNLVFFPSNTFAPAVNAYQKKMGFVVTVQVDDRDRNNLSFYRYNDSSLVDFCKIANEPEVIFTHNSGFIAKVCNSPELPQERIMELLSKSISLNE